MSRTATIAKDRMSSCTQTSNEKASSLELVADDSASPCAMDCAVVRVARMAVMHVISAKHLGIFPI